MVAVVPMRVSKRGSRRASREAKGRETRLVVWMPHVFFFLGGGFALGWLGAFWNCERDPHDKQGLASLRARRDDDDTLDDF